jgi:universal stress protein A
MIGWNKILCPVDFSDISNRALQLAASLARHFDGALLLVHVVEPIVAPADFTFGPMTSGEVEDRLVERSKTAVEDLVRTIDLPPDRVACRVERGRASGQIVKVAFDERSDLIVMGTHGYTGVAHALLGSTAERVLRKAPCPVLTIKAPDGEGVEPDED